MIRLGLDCDGVLCDFNAGFIQVLKHVTGRALVPDDYQPVTWQWPRYVGYTPEEERECWKAVMSVTSFWTSLRPLPGAQDFLGRLQAFIQAAPDREIYFITARPGNFVKQQTEWWLRRFGITNPSVLTTSHKAASAGALNLTHYVDDCYENFSNFSVAAPQTRAILLLATYNESLVKPDDGLVTIKNLTELWSQLECVTTN